MSKIVDIIARVDENRPNAFSSATKMKWISDLDGKIAADVFLMDIAQIRELEYRHPDGLEQEPLVTFPHDDIYDLWLEAKIDAANGEYNRYQNTMQLYNESYGNFVRWFASVYEPAQGENGCGFVHRSDLPSYYLTAYGIAVKRGFVGTVDEWLASLKGEKGDPGTDPVAIQQAVDATVPGAVATALDDALPTAVRKAVAKTLPDAVSEALKDVPEPKEEKHAANKAYVDAGLADKAPAGYGLGQTVLTLVSSLEELDNLLTTGWYRLHAVGTTLNGVAFNYALVFVCMNGENGYQEIRPVATNYVLKRFRYNGSFGDWCCDNPPMRLGVEYRTTELYLGKTVYVKLYDCGAATNGKVVSHGLNKCHIVNYDSEARPFFFGSFGTSGTSNMQNIWVAVSMNAINIYCGESAVGEQVYCRIYYTKD